MLLNLFELSNESKAIGLTAQALRAVFQKDQLEELLRTQLNLNLQDLTLADNFRKITFDVARTGAVAGWLPRLIGAAKNEFPANAAFQADCDQILTLLETAKPHPVLGATPSSRRIVNLSLGGIFLFLLAVWGILLFGWTASYYVGAGVAAWLVPNIAQYFLESEKLRRLDELLGQLLDHRWTTNVLAGLLGAGLAASLFLGTVEAPPAFTELPVRRSLREEDRLGRPLDPGSTWPVATVPWGGRTVFALSDGYLPQRLTVWPWWRQHLRSRKFELAPYVLLALHHDFTQIFNVEEAGRLEIDVDGQKQPLDELEYRGEPVLLGDLGDSDHQHVPVWIARELEARMKELKLEGQVTKELNLPLHPGAQITVRPMKYQEQRDGSRGVVREPRAERSFRVKPPKSREDALKSIILGQAD